MRLSVLALLLVPAFAACSGHLTDLSVNCPDVLTTPLTASVSDAATGEALAANALVVARGGALVDTLRFFPTVSDTSRQRSKVSPLVRYPAGDYVVSVTRAGYLPWQGTAHITATRCGTSTASVTAPLTHA